MTLPATTIKFSELRDEFDDTNPVVFSEYYADLLLLPLVMNTEFGIPTSGVLALSDFQSAERTWGITSVVSGDNRGYSLGSYGSFDKPAVTFDGETIEIISTNALADSFLFQLDGIVADNFFTSIEITGSFFGGSNPRTITYLESNATHSQPANTQWLWLSVPNDDQLTASSYTIVINK